MIFSIASIAIDVGFQQYSPLKFSFDIAISIFCFLDMVLSFNTALYHEASRMYTTNRYKICISYIKFWFWIDLVSSIPSEIIQYRTHILNSHSISLRIIQFCRIFKFFKKNYYPLTHVYVRVLISIIISFAIAHSVVCLWYYVTVASPAPDTWIDAYSDQILFRHMKDSIQDHYFASFFWFGFTTTSVGYGSIVAIKNIEMVFATITALLGNLVLNAAIARILNIVENLNPTKKAYEEQMEHVTAYVNHFRLSMPLKNAVKVSYIIYIYLY